MAEAHTCLTEERLKVYLRKNFRGKKKYKCYKWQFRDHYKGNKRLEGRNQ